ncbi:hypothetical protein CMO86_01720 [Candidatus Woesearchaeota archaeon]|jgi:hypothetical protein|nr:hypothetical protein [Candidatus Woesearchaeota archaeon]|tara:strand:+ start:2967 stop:3242 length:276 start_codon:yes stop_codon:yes gene_type:complete
MSLGKIKKIPYKLVQVHWLDISSDSTWRSVEDVKSENLARSISTGYLISDEDDELVRIVSDFNFKDDGTIYECGNSTIIPKNVITEVIEVK